MIYNKFEVEGKIFKITELSLVNPDCIYEQINAGEQELRFLKYVIGYTKDSNYENIVVIKATNGYSTIHYIGTYETNTKDTDYDDPKVIHPNGLGLLISGKEYHNIVYAGLWKNSWMGDKRDMWKYEYQDGEIDSVSKLVVEYND